MRGRRLSVIAAASMALAAAAARPLRASVEPLQEIGLAKRAPKPTTPAEERRADPVLFAGGLIKAFRESRRRRNPSELALIAAAAERRARRQMRNIEIVDRRKMIAA